MAESKPASVKSYSKSQATADARRALLNSYHGALSTIIREGNAFETYPMGSVVPFVLDNNGKVILLISDLAEHTKNVRANPQVSLLIYDTTNIDVQRSWRLTIIGDLKQIKKEEDIRQTAERYYRFYPDSSDYHITLDFHFYRLQAKTIRYIHGFGKMTWVDANDDKPGDGAAPVSSSTFDFATEKSIIEHMNKDHQNAMRHYLYLQDIQINDNEVVNMVSISQYGCHLRFRNSIQFIEFSQLAETPMQVREALVKLAKQTRTV